jgi:hypothetical protein
MNTSLNCTERKGKAIMKEPPQIINTEANKKNSRFCELRTPFIFICRYIR